MTAKFFRGRFFMLVPLMALMVISTMSVSSSAAGEDEDTGWLGVHLRRLTPDLREAMDIPTETGVLVADVVEDSPAEKADFEVGDIILKYDGQTVSSPRGLSKLVRETAPGKKVTVEISRDGEQMTLTAEIGAREGIEKLYKIKISGDEGEERLLFHCPGGMEWFGLPHRFSTWLGSDIWLGVHTVDLTDQLAKYFDIKDGRGVLISEVVEDSPAEKAKLQAGDVIVKADGERIEDTPDLREAIDEHEEGQEMEVVVVRKGKEKTVKLTLEKSPHRIETKFVKKLKRLPRKLKEMKFMGPHHDVPEIDLEVEKILEDYDMEDLESRLEELEEELERIKDKLEMD